MAGKCVFSVVTVSFNCVGLIAKTIESILRQDYASLEYIVIDGGSTDGTAEIIRKYQDRLAYWCSEPDGGIYQGMNKGIQHVQGDWIIFMNAGDTFADDHVLSQVASYADKERYDILYGDIFTTRDEELRLKRASAPCNKQRMYFCHQAAFAKTSILRKMPFDTRFRMSADFHFFKRCYLMGYRFRHLPVTVAIYDSHGVSHMRRVEGLQDNIRVVKALDKGWDRIKFLCKLYYVVGWLRITGR